MGGERSRSYSFAQHWEEDRFEAARAGAAGVSWPMEIGAAVQSALKIAYQNLRGYIVARRFVAGTLTRKCHGYGSTGLLP